MDRYRDEFSALEALGLPERHQETLGRLGDASMAEEQVPSRVKDLGVCLAYVNKGNRDEARRHGELALAAGLTRAEAFEGLLTGVLSRGFAILWHGLWIAEAAPEAAHAEPAEAEATDTRSILAYFGENFGGVPPWLELLAESSTNALEAYYALRNDVMRDGVLLRKHKEMLLVIVNSAERYGFGVETHVKGALAGGATRVEILEAIRASIVVGGLVAWLEAAAVAAPLLPAD